MRHPEDHDLLLATGGESAEAEAHLAWCAGCRARQAHLLAEVEAAKAAGMVDGAPNVLQARMRTRVRTRRCCSAAGVVAALVLLAISLPSDEPVNILPQPKLTPGAARAANRSAVCATALRVAKPPIPETAANEVFQRYGLSDASPGLYEVDHLIPVELGGTDAPGNLWPQPYRSGKWNSRVKNALEERLRTLVCDGALDLRTAQKEISADWVSAYRKYFRTEEPQPEHLASARGPARK